MEIVHDHSQYGRAAASLPKSIILKPEEQELESHSNFIMPE